MEEIIIDESPAEVQALSQELANVQNHISILSEQIQTLTLMLEVTNERWVKAVNDNLHLEVEVRKLRASRQGV